MRTPGRRPRRPIDGAPETYQKSLHLENFRSLESSSATQTGRPSQDDLSSEFLALKIQSLPQELQDHIINLTFSIPQHQIILITYSYTPPSILNVSKAIRGELWPKYFGKNQFLLQAPGDFWHIYEKWSSCKSFFPEGYEEAEGMVSRQRETRISDLVAGEGNKTFSEEEERPCAILRKYRSGITPWTVVYHGI
ncbi:hypothetical protein CB0940_03101 [Cercospora beticola]|uniref:F-box domain-containing protein n=1 Tax=Cercospora beticola TaxID=122368 RepID=A0A2G5I2W4_CERBT|nr:hypothetical protein CB0940_03101 [Cercospora beticola]PIA99155.1 hypothetical protein CB0940_03101 [Cercospora beticola]WPB00267.1 hypothetical protein RHO25_004886 [Cercospora beticola]